LHVFASVGFANDNANIANIFRITVDGAALRGVAVTNPSANAACAAAIVGVKATVAAGSHTVALQWRVGSGPATLRVRPAGNAEREHATLLVYEAT